MKNNRGISLIEIIAVIGIFGIIAYIATQSFVALIRKQRLDAMKKAEELFLIAAENYVLDNPVLLPSENNQSVVVKLETLIELGLIKPIQDQFSEAKETCWEHLSYAKITKLRENKYDYKVNLVCPNYITDALQFMLQHSLIGENGDMEVANSSGNAKGWNIGWNPNQKSLSTEQKFSGKKSQYLSYPDDATHTNDYGGMTYNLGANLINVNHIYYLVGYVYRDERAKGTIGINLYNQTKSQTNMTPTGNVVPNHWTRTSTWIDLKTRPTYSLNDTFYLYFYLNMSGGVREFAGYMDSVAIIDLTELFGAGNEPSKEVLDSWLQNSN